MRSTTDQMQRNGFRGWDRNSNQDRGYGQGQGGGQSWGGGRCRVHGGLRILAVGLLLLTAADEALAHGDKGEGAPRYEGPGYSADSSGQSPLDFESRGVDLLSWTPLGEFDEAVGVASAKANDIWGYASPSGGEYAIIGLQRGVGFVDITTPTQPQVIAGFVDWPTTWRDIKTYGPYAYAVADDSGSNPSKNLSIYDLSQIDSGVVTLANTVTTGRTHNVVIDPDSGFLYRTGSQDGDAKGLMIYDLNADPVNPPLVGQWGGRYIHDAQAVTLDSGPFAGRQVVFAFAENNSGGGNAALDILDVTDKADIQLLGRAVYDNNRYSHQGWLSPDRRYVYLDDELDELNDAQVITTTTRVIDISDLTNPVVTGTFTNGQIASDHNLFTRDQLIFEANYRSGLRVFDATNPEAPVEVAYFDTQPNSTAPGFTGLWGNHPHLPSGVVIGSDTSNGLFVWQIDAQPANAWADPDAGGDWNAPANWSQSQAPAGDDALLIAAAQDLTVQGPQSPTQIYSLSLSSNPGGQPTLQLQPGGTLHVEHMLILEGSSRLTGSGVVDGPVLGATVDARIEAVDGGALTLGDPDSNNGFRNLGLLSVGSAAVTLLGNTPVRPGRVATLEGGVLSAPNGVELFNGDELRGFGTVEAQIISNQNAPIIADGGQLFLGDPDQPDALEQMEGSLVVGSSQVTLRESDPVELNAEVTTLASGGVLYSPTGIILQPDKTIDASTANANDAHIRGAFTNLGQVAGPTSDGASLRFDDKVIGGGGGGYTGNIRFNAVFELSGDAAAALTAAHTHDDNDNDNDVDADDQPHDPENDPGHDHADTDAMGQPDPHKESTDTDHDDPVDAPIHAPLHDPAAVQTATFTLIDGNLTFGSAAKLRVRLEDDADDDLLIVTGHAQLNGRLSIELENGFSPTQGDVFEVLFFDTVGGAFNRYDGDVFLLDDDLALVPVVGDESLRLQTTAPGDANADGRVDSQDLNTLAVNWRQRDRDWFSGDFNGDGFVDAADLNLLAVNWQTRINFPTSAGFEGAFAAALAALTTPEPGSATSLLMISGLICRLRRFV